MKVELHKITVRDIVEGYVDNSEEGVTGYNGKLNVRPKYQREFVYDEKKRNAVIDTIRKNFPLNVMYWASNNDDSYELLDGQQRTISFCQYVIGDFPVLIDGRPMFFHNLTSTEQTKILDYMCMIYICEGNDKEKLDWFKIVNIAGEKLTDQELRNAIYTGPWLTHAKTIFSKNNCAAYALAKDYVKGSPIRQELLQTAISWISDGDIEKYMSVHQHNPNANELWTYFQNVINWVTLTFGCPKNYRKEMKGLNWGGLYDAYKGEMYDTDKLEKEVAMLMMDDEVTNKKGIYIFLLSKNERVLNIRSFTEAQKREAYENQKGICPGWHSKCGKHFKIDEMHADHITPWSRGGKTIPENCQLLCAECNRRKSGI